MAFIIPWIFRAGTKAKSAEVNENFLAVKQFVDLLEDDIATNQISVQTLEDTKANINGSPIERFQVANGIVGNDAVNMNTLEKSTQNVRGYIDGYTLSATNKVVTASAGSCYSYNVNINDYEYLIKSNVKTQTNALTLSPNQKYYVFIYGNSSGTGTPKLAVDTNFNSVNYPPDTDCYRRIGSFRTDGSSNIQEILKDGERSLLGFAKYPNYSAGENKTAGTEYTATKNGMITITLRMNNSANTTFKVNGITICNFFGGGEYTSNEHFTCFVSTGNKYKLENVGINNISIYKFFPEK